MVRERYKDTELGKIPEDWGINSIFTTIVPTVQINPLNSPNKKIKYIDISSISRDLLKIINYTEFLGRDAPSRARKQVNENDIIFSTVRPYLKQIYIVQPTLKNELCSTGFCIIRFEEKLVFYLYGFYFVTQDTFIRKVSRFESGSNYSAVLDKHIFSQLIPLPPSQNNTASPPFSPPSTYASKRPKPSSPNSNR